ncbi:MAG: undecaprenyldiphospho-muramoylpentapeptide beta-N-acetylglucosaminyltransferase, partial [Elusimicrobia bacterium]|nr:undecaprenyldiphospho-muramoylpentapeptide beta-N-acetylglucosaminyltransferase [Elusimicrobiota bacterium]
MKKNARVLISAGGTGGHILPGLAVAKILRERGHRVHFAVKKDEKTPAFLAREKFSSSAFQFEGFPRNLSIRSLTFPVMAAAALACARRILRRETPDVVLGMGGYITVPVGVAAIMRRVPLVVHEQNVRAGLANRLLSRWARAAAVSFEETVGLSSRVNRTVVTGLPLRPDVVPQDPAQSRLRLGLDPQAPTLLIFGGSQGARSLNARVWAALPKWAAQKPRWQYIHLTGPADEPEGRTVYQKFGLRAHVTAYLADMAAAYSAADAVVARGGANTVMELRRMGRTALLIPYPHATDNHQTDNARYLERLGLARV